MPVAGEWSLAVDFGTSFTSAATISNGQLATLPTPDGGLIPSVVWLDPANQFLTGQRAVESAEQDAASAVRQPKRALITSPTMRLGGRTVLAPDAAAAVLHYAYSAAMSIHGGSQPRHAVLSHPAYWADDQIEEYLAAAEAAGIRRPTPVAEPVAAARHYVVGCPARDCAGADRLEPSADGYLLVHDFGAGTDITVVRCESSRLTMQGEPVHQPDLGGDELDERLLDLVADRARESEPGLWESLDLDGAPPLSPAMIGLRKEITAARERLSAWRHADVTIPGSATAIRVTRPEFEAAIEPELSQTIALAERALRSAGVGPAELSEIVLAGGANRTPGVSDALSKRFDLPLTAPDPKAVVAHGALLAFTSAWRDTRKTAVINPADRCWLYEDD
jgi:molecular chaperone DnaK (HSP70)